MTGPSNCAPTIVERQRRLFACEPNKQSVEEPTFSRLWLPADRAIQDRTPVLGFEAMAVEEFLYDVFRGPEWQAAAEVCVNHAQGYHHFEIHSGEHWRNFFSTPLPEADGAANEDTTPWSLCGIFLFRPQRLALRPPLQTQELNILSPDQTACRKPGPKPKENWQFELGRFLLGRGATPTHSPNVDALTRDTYAYFQEHGLFLPADSKVVRKIILEYLTLKPNKKPR